MKSSTKKLTVSTAPSDHRAFRVRRHGLPLSRSPKRGAPREPARPWLAKYPPLAEAYREARRLFGDRPDVLGIGIGRPLRESTGTYREVGRGTGGMCIKIYVGMKIPLNALAAKTSLPRELRVKPPGARRRARVLVDVVELGPGPTARACLGAGQLQSGEARGWPTSGVLSPGRLFAFGLAQAAAASGQFMPPPDPCVELGTVGCLVRSTVNGACYAVSAGHVFCDTCAGSFEAPRGPRAIGAQARTFHRVPSGSFYPLRLRVGPRIRDAMVFRLPPALVPDGAVSWPGGFRRGFARPADIKAALRPGATLDGYVAVERGERSGHGWPGRVPVDLEGYVPFFEATVDCGNGHVVTLKYGFVWQLRFTRTNPSAATSTTIPGDSGAPVFLRSADGIGVGLLGFHFFEYNGRSYAVDAETLCRELVGHPGRDFTFA